MAEAGRGTSCGRMVEGEVCGQPRLPGKPVCSTCDLAILVIMRERFPEEADRDFEREVPRG